MYLDLGIILLYSKKGFKLSRYSKLVSLIRIKKLLTWWEIFLRCPFSESIQERSSWIFKFLASSGTPKYILMCVLSQPMIRTGDSFIFPFLQESCEGYNSITVLYVSARATNVSNTHLLFACFSSIEHAKIHPLCFLPLERIQWHMWQM